MVKRKALVLYGSITGNTQQIAEAFREVCEEYNLETDIIKITPDHNWDEEPVFVEDYDLVMLGSPIIAGLPYKIVSLVVGLQGETCLIGPKRNKARMEANMKDGVRRHEGSGIPGIVAPAVGTGTPGAKGDNGKTIYGVVFCTYGGSGCGPVECEGALANLTEYLRGNGVRAVGRFACPGKELRKGSVGQLAELLKINIDDSQAMLQRYKDDPGSNEFKELAPTQLEELKREAAGTEFMGGGALGHNDPLGCSKPGCGMWHYDYDNRPTARDVSKAKIFLSEIIEDYFLTLTGDPRAPYSVYTCIS